MKLIKLTRGFSATVDDDDFEILNQWRWFATTGHRITYAARRIQVFPGKQQKIWMHRQILGAVSGEDVDHKNNNGVDNQKHNLRKCSRAENIRNSRRARNNVSGFKGVSWSVASRKWRTVIRINNTQCSLGVFSNLMAAARAYDAAAKKHFGEFACLNFPESEGL
jgi:hypothetical protein